MGVMFGPAAFLWIVLGTIFAGAVHDFLSGMISVRMGGLSLPEIVGSQLGRGVKNVMAIFSIVLLLMVGAVFVTSPAGILAGMTPAWLSGEVWVLIIFAYYVCATVLPVDKLIGSLYPVFGFALLFMAIEVEPYKVEVACESGRQQIALYKHRTPASGRLRGPPRYTIS